MTTRETLELVMDAAGVPVLEAHDVTWAKMERRRTVNAKTGEVTETALATELNVQAILTHDPRWQGRIRWDRFRGGAMLDGEELSDVDVVRIMLWIARCYGFRMPKGAIHDVCDVVAHENGYHPVTDYLDGLEWDGVERISGWLSTYCGVEDSPIVRAYARKWLISAVARVYEPGCKVDTLLVLAGGQGVRKSSALRVLARSWFSDSDLNLDSKDAYMALTGCWIVEIGEMYSISKREAAQTKAFVSSQTDRYRPPYGRRSVNVPRQCVFAATSNNEEFLTDPTGSRRYWPVSVGAIDLERLEQAVDQLWAEARVAYQAGEPWWLDGAQEQQRIDASHRFQETDPWLPVLAKWVKAQVVGYTINEALEAVGVDTDRQTRGHQMRAAGVLTRLEQVKKRARRDGRLVWLWGVPTVPTFSDK